MRFLFTSVFNAPSLSFMSSYALPFTNNAPTTLIIDHTIALLHHANYLYSSRSDWLSDDEWGMVCSKMKLFIMLALLLSR